MRPSSSRQKRLTLIPQGEYPAHPVGPFAQLREPSGIEPPVAAEKPCAVRCDEGDDVGIARLQEGEGQPFVQFGNGLSDESFGRERRREVVAVQRQRNLRPEGGQRAEDRLLARDAVFPAAGGDGESFARRFRITLPRQPRHAADAVAAHLRLRTVGVEHPHSETSPPVACEQQQAVDAEPVQLFCGEGGNIQAGKVRPQRVEQQEPVSGAGTEDVVVDFHNPVYPSKLRINRRSGKFLAGTARYLKKISYFAKAKTNLRLTIYSIYTGNES